MTDTPNPPGASGQPPAPADGSAPNLAAKASKRALAFILITVGIDVVGIGIIIPVLPELIREVEGTGIGLGEAAFIGGWLMFAYAFMQFLSAPVLGGLSDRFGRRPVLLISLGVLAIDYVIMAVAPTLTWLFIGRILSGLAGASFVTAYAYIADVSPKETRAANFGLIGMAFGVGFVIGPAIGGLLGAIDPRLPFWAAAAICAAGFVFGFFALPESLAPEKRRRFEIARANPLGTLRHFWGIKPVLMLIIAGALLEFAMQVYPAVWAYFTPVQFGWSTADVGVSLAVFGILIAVGEGFILRVALKRYGEHRVILSSTLLAIACFAAFAVTPNGSWGYVVMTLSAISGFGSSGLQGLASNAVGETEQGELNGAVMSATAIVAFIAPPITTGLFSAFTPADGNGLFFPGAPFVFAALVACFVFLPYARARALGIRDSAGQG
ncbi:MAG: MFS transporter [Devosiaceae bacterium]|nr:MFS transporter [Devosiaceae bacterium MH13]